MSAEDKEQQLNRSEADSSATIAALEDGEKAKEEGVTPRDQDASAQHDNSAASATDDPATDVDKAPEAALDPSEEKDEYPRGIKLLMLLLSIYLAVFLVALDRTIIATALPQITNHFNSFADVGWYNAAFLLPMTALQLFFGRMYTFYSPKWIFITLVIIFEIGSAVCGAAPTSVGFIWGRAVAGLGAGGLFNGAMVLMMYAAPLKKRPLYMGLLGAVFGIASVAGPLLGGVFTTKVTWRWCFYINLPIGAAVLAFLIVVVEDTPAALHHLSVKEKIARLDIYGTIIFVPCMVCLLLALQWGGQQYPWSDGRIIALLTLFGVLLLVFIGIQLWQQESATVPPRIAKNRTVAAGAFYSFTLGSSFMMIVYYLSIWFQAIKGDTAIRSGYSTIPFILSLVVASIFSGVLVTRIGYYNPSLISGAVLAPIGVGLLTLFRPDTNHSMWIGVQVLIGFAVGLGLQQTNIAAQTVLDKKDAPTGISMVFFGQGLGGTISVAVGQNLLDNKLVSSLANTKGVNAYAIIKGGATGWRTLYVGEQFQEVLTAYNHALMIVFYAALGFSCATIFGALAMEWKSVKGPAKEKRGEKV